MLFLKAKDALSDEIPCVPATILPSQLSEEQRAASMVALIDAEGAFSGFLITKNIPARESGELGRWIVSSQPAPVADDAPLVSLFADLRGSPFNALPVTDESGAYAGALTYESVVGAIAGVQERIHLEDRSRDIILKSVTDVIFTIKIPDAVYEYVSPSVRNLLGCTPQQLYDDPLLAVSLVPESQREFFRELWPRICQGNIEPAFEFEVFDTSGNLHWVNQRNVLIRDDKGDPVELICIATDVTERHESEQRLRYAYDELEARVEHRTMELTRANDNLQTEIHDRTRAESWYKGILEASPEAMGLCAPDGKLLFCNAQMARVHGYTDPEELVGRNYSMFVVQSDLRKYNSDMQAIQKGDTIRERELTHLRADGSEFPASVSMSSIRTSDGILEGSVTVVRDITRRRRISELLHAQIHLALRLAGTSTLDEALEACLEAALELNRTEWGYVMILNRDNGDVELSCSRGLSGVSREALRVLPADSPGAVRVLEGQMGVFDQVAATYLPDDPEVREGMKLVVTVPIFHEGQPVGSLSLGSRTQRSISEETLSALRALTVQLGSVFARLEAEHETSLGQKRLEEIQAVYRTVIENALGIPYQLDLRTGKYLFLGEQCEKVLGFRLDEMNPEFLQKRVAEIHVFDPEEPTLSPDEYTRKFLDGRLATYHADLRILTRDGEEKWLSNCAIPVHDPSGNVIGSMGILLDITSRKQTEEALRLGEQRYRSVIEISPDAVLIAEPDRRIVHCNAAAVRLYGCRTAADLVGKDLLDLLAPETVQRTHSHMMGVYDQGVVRDHETVVLRADGSTFPAELSASVLRDKDGRPTMFVSVCRDISDRVAAREALQSSEQRYRDVVETSPDAIVMCSSDGTVRLANQQAALMAGLESAADLVGLNIFAFLATSEKDEGFADLAALKAGDHIRSKTYLLRRKSGSPRFVSVNASPQSDPTGQTIGFIMLSRDITEQVELSKEREVMSQLSQQLAGTRTVEEVAARMREALDQLFVWDSMLFSVRRSGRSIFEAVLQVDVNDHGVKQEFVSERGATNYRRLPAVVKGQPILINRGATIEEPAFARFGNVDRLSRSLCYAPVRADGKVTGIISIQSYQEGHFGEPDLKMLQRLADLVGPALERCAAERLNQALTALSRRLSQSRSPHDAAMVIARVADELLGWDALALDYYDPDQDMASPVITIDLVDGKRQENAHPGAKPTRPTPMMRAVVSQGARLVLRPDHTTDDAPLELFGSMRAAASLMFVPLRSSNRVVGMLTVQSYSPGAYSDDDLRVLQAFADQCGGAILRTEVEAAEARLATAVESASESIIITGTDWHIQYVNPAFEQVSGYSRGEVIGRLPRELLDAGQQDDDFYRNIEKTLANGEVWSGRLVSLTKDGKVIEEDATISPIRDRTGRLVSHVAVKRDVTQEVMVQTELLHAQKMEAVGHLAGGLAHDFNNVLHITLNYGKMLVERLPAGSQDRSAAEGILRAAKRGDALVAQLMAFSRKQVLKPRILNLNGLVRGIETLIRQLIGSNCDLVLKLEKQLGTTQVDPGQIEMVVINMATNARDAMPDGGTLTIQTANLELDAYSTAAGKLRIPPGQYVALLISDTGHGMDSETKARIFEPFFTTKETGKGTGLGLSSAHGVISQSGGYVSVSSQLGRGTVFKIYLPRAAEQEILVPDAPAVTDGLSGSETILLIEDEDEVRRLTKATLRMYGYRVIEAASGEEAVRIAKEQTRPVHAVVADILMPGMSGQDAADLLKSSCPDAKVLFMSGYVSNDLVQQVVRSGTRRFIQKPFDPDELVRAVRRMLDGPDQ